MPITKWGSLISAGLVAGVLATTGARVEAKPPVQVRIDVRFAEIGSPGNAPDSLTGSGSVGQIFTIGRDDVTVGQYTTFLNAVAGKDPYDLYTPGMATDMNIAGILRSGRMGGPYTYSVIGEAENPIAMVSWLDAARFCNWLHNGQPLAPEGPKTTETGAYTLNGDTTMGLEIKNPDAKYWLPTLDQWYKAAYYNALSSDYDMWPTGTSVLAPSNVVTSTSNAANFVMSGLYSVTQSSSLNAIQNYLTRVGSFHDSRSPFGCEDMGGDVAQWTDTTDPATTNTTRFIPGGGWDLGSSYFKAQTTYLDANPTEHYADVGFRVASMPVPVSMGLYGGITDGTNGVLLTNVGETGLFSSKFTVNDTSYLFTGQLTPQLTYSHTYLAHNQSLGVTYTMGLDDIVGNIVLNGTGNYNVTARRDPYTLKGYPFLQAGQYNFAMLSDTDPLNSSDFGSGRMTISTQGLVDLIGEFSDGTAFTEGTVLTGRGEVPAYVPSSGSTNGLSGCMSVSCGGVTGRVLLGELPSVEREYAVGSFYQAPKPNIRTWNFLDVIGNGVFEAYGPGDNYLTGAYFTLNPNNSIVPVDLGPGHPSFLIYPQTGWITGKFWNPSFEQYTPISGTVLQKENVGIGYFQPGLESGEFLMYANPQFGTGVAGYGLGGVDTLPKIKFTLPLNGATINPIVEPSISFAGTASAKDGIGSVSYQVLYQGYVSDEIAAGGSNNWSFTYTPAAGATGKYNFFVRATDVKGNQSNLNELQIYVTPRVIVPGF